MIHSQELEISPNQTELEGYVQVVESMQLAANNEARTEIPQLGRVQNIVYLQIKYDMQQIFLCHVKKYETEIKEHTGDKAMG